MFVNFEFIAIVTVQAGQRAEPHKTFLILKNAGYIIVRKAGTDIEMRELKLIALGRSKQT